MHSHEPVRQFDALTATKELFTSCSGWRAQPGENIFVVKDGKITTPPLSTSILPGITRDSVIQLALERGYVVEEADIIRTDLYLAEEVFMTGTAAEVTPVRAIDDVEVGVGPVTLELQGAYLDVVNGRSDEWSHWLDVVEVRDEVANV